MVHILLINLPGGSYIYFYLTLRFISWSTQECFRSRRSTCQTYLDNSSSNFNNQPNFCSNHPVRSISLQSWQQRIQRLPLFFFFFTRRWGELFCFQWRFQRRSSPSTATPYVLVSLFCAWNPATPSSRSHPLSLWKLTSPIKYLTVRKWNEISTSCFKSWAGY